MLKYDFLPVELLYSIGGYIFCDFRERSHIHFIWGYAKFIYCHEIEEVGPFLESMELDNISHNFLYNLG